MRIDITGSTKVLIFAAALFASLLLFILLPGLPQLSHPLPDSTVFQYLGSRLLDGEIPYRDIWDHKGPIIYFIDALGYAVGFGSPVGIWVLEFASVTLASMLGFIALRRFFDTPSALIASVMWIMTLTVVLQRGNLTETWALPAQFGSLLLLTFIPNARRLKNKRRLALIAFGIGVLGSFAFFLRPNLISIWIAMAAVLIFRSFRREQLRENLRFVSFVFAGGTMLALIFVIFFWANNAIAELWDQMFVYNLTYTSSVTISDRVISTLRLFTTVARSGAGMMIASGLGFLIVLVMLVSKLSDRSSEFRIPVIVLVAIIALPMEILFSSGLSGRASGHYVQSWLPGMTILAAFTIHLVFRNLNIRVDGIKDASLRSGVVGLILISISVVPTLLILEDLYETVTDPAPVIEVVEYIRQNTNENDQVLVWGTDIGINLHSGRQTPTRFLTQYPLFAPGYSSEKLYLEFREGVQKAMPAMIVDSSFRNDRIPSFEDGHTLDIDCGNECTFEYSEQYGSFLKFLSEEYQLVKSFSTGGARRDVYQLGSSVMDGG
jgi:hypothetical protein